MIKENDKALDFELEDANGKKVKLSDYKKVVLYFYPKDNTPGCTLEACSLRDNFNNFKKKGYVILGISADDKKSHKKFVEKYEIPFILLCDTTKEVCKKYNAYGKKKFLGKEYMGIIRKTYIINDMRIKQIIEDVNCKTHGEDLLKII